MAGGLDKVDTGMDAVIDDVCTVDLVFSLQVSIVSLLNVLHNRAPRIIVVDKITKSRSVDNSQAETHAVLFDISADGLDIDGLGNDVVAGSSAFLGGVKGGVEQSVHEGRFSQSRFT